jgi:hypothetical protein
VVTVVLCAVSVAIPSFDLPGLFLEVQEKQVKERILRNPVGMRAMVGRVLGKSSLRELPRRREGVYGPAHEYREDH